MAKYNVENIKSVDSLEQKKEEQEIKPMIFAPDEPRVTINERILEIPDELKTIGVENDNNVERIYFEIPRYFDEVNDLSEFTVYINYLNANQEPNKYHCTDVEVEGENIVFSWLTSEHVYSYRGTVRFIVYAVASDNRKWNSTVAELFVMEGLETEEQIIDNNPDIIDELINMKPQVEEALQRIDEQQGVIDQQQDTIEEQQSTIAEQQKDIEDTINNLNTKIENGDFTPEFTIGDVETVEPSVPAEVNQTGTQLDPILNFKIPRGATNVVDNLDGTSVAEAPSQRVVKEAVDNINTEIDQIKDTGVQVADTLPIGSVIGWDSEEDYPTDIYEEVDYNPKQLLVNPDFQINQRGQTSYSGDKYTWDMWYIRNATLTQESDGRVTLSGGTNKELWQFIQGVKDNTVTFAISVNGSVYTGTATNVLDGENHDFAFDQDNFYIRLHNNPSRGLEFVVAGRRLDGGSGDTNLSIEYIDLFEGNIAYPHVKEDYQEALLRCQRKIINLQIPEKIPYASSVYFTGENFPVPMDENPEVVKVSLFINADDVSGKFSSANVTRYGVVHFSMTEAVGMIRGFILLSCEPL